MDDTIFYAAAQSEPLPVDLGAGASYRPQLVCLVLLVFNVTFSTNRLYRAISV